MEFGIYGLVLICYLALGIWNLTNAQAAPGSASSPRAEFLVSWRAKSYVPADYQGKILPSSGSSVEIGFDLIDKNKIADLSRYNITWFLGETFLGAGVGLQKLNLTLTDNRTQTVRITIGGYHGEADLEHLFLLPVVEPEAVISTRSPLNFVQNQFYLPLRNYLLEARPFFFNITSPIQLQFKWRVNGNLVSGEAENPNFLALNLESQGAPQLTEITVSLGVSNLLNNLELAGKSLNFVIR